MKIRLIGRWERHIGFVEQRYIIVKRYRGHWVLVEEGYLRLGSKKTQIFEHKLDRGFDPFKDDALGYHTSRGFCFVYMTGREYIDMCSLDERDLFENTPCPPWAVACVLP